MANVVDAPVIRQYFEYIRGHCGFLVCHRLGVSVQCQGANTTSYARPTRASGRLGLVQALGFKCIICDAEFATRRGADCHRRHPACSGTACADPSNMRSLSLTARSDPSVGTQDLSVRHISQDNDDPFGPFDSQETVSALV